jgi:hypothetical protein
MDLQTYCVGWSNRKETLLERIVITLSRQVKPRFGRIISKTKEARMLARSPATASITVTPTKAKQGCSTDAVTTPRPK